MDEDGPRAAEEEPEPGRAKTFIRLNDLSGAGGRPGQGDREAGSGDSEAEALPYPALAPVVFFYLSQESRPRSWCLRLVCNPYPLQVLGGEVSPAATPPPHPRSGGHLPAGARWVMEKEPGFGGTHHPPLPRVWGGGGGETRAVLSPLPAARPGSFLGCCRGLGAPRRGAGFPTRGRDAPVPTGSAAPLHRESEREPRAALPAPGIGRPPVSLLPPAHRGSRTPVCAPLQNHSPP